MTIWQHDEYYNTTTWQYDNMTTRQPDNTTTWQHDNTTSRQHENMTLWQRDFITKWKHDNVTTWQCHNMKTTTCSFPKIITTQQADSQNDLKTAVWPENRFFYPYILSCLCDFCVITSNLFDHRNLFELSEFWLYSMSSVTTGACSTLVPTTCLESSSSSTAAPLAAFMGNISHCRWQKGE